MDIRQNGHKMNVNIFTMDYIVVPIKKATHWLPAIICVPKLADVQMLWRMMETMLNVKGKEKFT